MSNAAIASPPSGRFVLSAGKISLLQAGSFAVAAVAIVFGVRAYLLAPILGDEAPMMLFLAAVAAAAWCGGLLAGLLATGLSTLVGAYFLLQPLHSFAIAGSGDRERMLMFVSIGLLISALNEALHSVRRDNRESERKLSTLLGNLPGMAYRMANDRRWTARFVSDGVMGITGFPPESFTSGRVHWMDLIHPEDRDFVWEAVQKAVREKTPFQFEYRLHDSEGRERWVWEQGVPVFGELAGVVALEGFVTDVTERKAAERALREGDRRKDEFLATLAHEIRNPLAVISNALDLMRLKPEDDPEELREMMARQAKQLARLMDDLMDVSRITRGKIELKKSRVDLGKVVESAIEGARFLVEAGGQELWVAPPETDEPGPVLVEADFDRLVQVLMNLLHNAAKFTPRGGRIAILTGRAGANAVVRVRDTGIGIPPDRLSSVFELFSQGHDAFERREGGLGIGLTVARSLVEFHGGAIEARSDGRGKGSEFVIRLPLAREELPQNGKRSESPFETPRPLRVLVVEDSKPFASVFGELLRSLGHRVECVENGDAALTSARSIAPDVVFSDISMPEMSGLRLAELLRRELLPEDTVLVAITGFGQEKDRQRSFDAGFDFHLVKPPTLEQLTELLSTIARERQPRVTP